MRSMLVIGLLCALQTPTAAAQCRSPEYRQFDFWVGDWDAYDLPDTAKAVARIQVSSIMDGCALREVYVQKDGLNGESFTCGTRRAGDGTRAGSPTVEPCSCSRDASKASGWC